MCRLNIKRLTYTFQGNDPVVFLRENEILFFLNRLTLKPYTIDRRYYDEKPILNHRARFTRDRQIGIKQKNAYDLIVLDIFVGTRETVVKLKVKLLCTGKLVKVKGLYRKIISNTIYNNMNT